MIMYWDDSYKMIRIEWSYECYIFFMTLPKVLFLSYKCECCFQPILSDRAGMTHKYPYIITNRFIVTRKQISSNRKSSKLTTITTTKSRHKITSKLRHKTTSKPRCKTRRKTRYRMMSRIKIPSTVLMISKLNAGYKWFSTKALWNL